MNMQPDSFASLFSVSRETIQRLSLYHDLLLKWQKAINLISPASASDIWGRHMADSAQLSAYIDEGLACVDMGSGAGFPAMVLAIMRPDLTVTCIESDQRKSEFLRTVSRETKTPINIMASRIESSVLQEPPAYFTARALAPLQDLMGYALALAPSGDWRMALLKGQKFDLECADARKIYEFDCKTAPSQTEPGGVIALISAVRRGK